MIVFQCQLPPAGSAQTIGLPMGGKPTRVLMRHSAPILISVAPDDGNAWRFQNHPVFITAYSGVNSPPGFVYIDSFVLNEVMHHVFIGPPQ